MTLTEAQQAANVAATLRAEKQYALDSLHAAKEEIERLRAEVESKSDQIGKLYKACNERDVLLNSLKGIAEYCSTDHGTLSAITRLVTIRNTADRAVAAYQQQPQPEKSK